MIPTLPALIQAIREGSTRSVLSRYRGNDWGQYVRYAGDPLLLHADHSHSLFLVGMAPERKYPFQVFDTFRILSGKAYLSPMRSVVEGVDYEIADPSFDSTLSSIDYTAMLLLRQRAPSLVI